MSLIREKMKRSSEGRLPLSGKIRPGMKIPTKASAANPLVMKYWNMARNGAMSMDEAEAKIFDETKIKYPFRPENTAHFNINPGDFEGGLTATQKLMDLYGEDRGQGRNLYRFPVVFPDMPNGIDDFFKGVYKVSSGPIKYFSKEGDDSVRRCMYLQPVEKDAKTRNMKFVPRVPQVRGNCSPADCSEFKLGACRFRGDLHFYIPGMVGSGYFSIGTGSTYASEDIFGRLDQISERLGGRLPKFTPDGSPVFWLTKILKSVTFHDAEGEKHRDQWVPSIETLIEMPKLLLLEERRMVELAAPSAAPTAAIPASWGMTVAPPQPVTTGARSAELVVTQSAASLADQETGEIQNTAAEVTLENKVTSALDQLIELSAKLQIDDELIEWASDKYGENWSETDVTVGKVANVINKIIATGGHESVKPKLRMFNLIKASGLSAEEVVVPYLSSKFDGMRNATNLANAAKHLRELLDAGPQVARVTMEHQLAVT